MHHAAKSLIKLYSNKVASHTGGPGDSGDVQLLPLPVSFHKSVGGEALDGEVHLEGHPLTCVIVGVNKIAGARGSVPVQ